jgi:hypothetical protein
MRDDWTGRDATGLETNCHFHKDDQMETDEHLDAVQYHPLDETKLFKGQAFTVAELEPMLGLKFPHDQWWSRLLGLKEWITRRRREVGLPELTMRTPRGVLVILTDSEATRYNAKMQKHGIRRFSRAGRRNAAVDRSQLTEAERGIHDRSLARHAMIRRAIIGAVRAPLTVEGPKRTTPPMVAGPT